MFHKHKLQNLHCYHTKHAFHANCGKQAEAKNARLKANILIMYERERVIKKKNPDDRNYFY